MNLPDATTGRGRLDLFKTFTLQWWQAGLYKLGMLALTLAVGSHWHEIFDAYLLPLCVIAVPSLGYVTYVWWKQ